MKLLNDIIDSYESISLDEMDSVALMNRVDTKYQVSRTVALEILNELAGDYNVLEIEGKRQFQYLTTYFDTVNRYLLNEHLRGKLNRVKVRVREYVESNKTFFEVKLKTNKGRTIKSRIEKVGPTTSIDEKEAAFLAEKTTLQANTLEPAINLDFTRITLVSTVFKERLTFDFNLTFKIKKETRSAKEMVIVELKRDSESAPRTPVTKVLKELSVYPSSMSKYCIGMILFNETERYNQYKPKLLKLNKLSTNGNIW